MKVDRAPFVLFLFLQCARYGLPLPSPVESTENLAPRNELGISPGEVVHDGGHLGDDVHGNTDGGWKDYEQSHGAEGAPVHPDDPPGSAAAKDNGDASGAAPHDETVEVNGVKGKYDKAADDIEIECDCSGSAKRRRDDLFKREKGICFPDRISEVAEFNRAWGQVDKAAAKTSQKAIEWTSTEIIRRIRSIEPDQFKNFLESADSSLIVHEIDKAGIANPNFQLLVEKIPKGSSQIYIINENPYFDPRSSKISSDSGALSADEELSRLSFGPSPAGLRASPLGSFDLMPDQSFESIPRINSADLSELANMFTPAEFAQVYESQMQVIISRKSFKIQDQIDLQARWLDLIRMQDPMDSIAAETNLLDHKLEIMKYREYRAKNPNNLGPNYYIHQHDVTYFINQPSKLSESWYQRFATDKEAKFDNPEGKAFKEAYRDYFAKEKEWNRLGDIAERKLEKLAKLEDGTLQEFFRKKLLTKETNPNTDAALSDKGIRIRAQGNKITVAGTQLMSGNKVALTVTSGVIGGTAIVVVCGVDGTNCQFNS